MVTDVKAMLFLLLVPFSYHSYNKPAQVGRSVVVGRVHAFTGIDQITRTLNTPPPSSQRLREREKKHGTHIHRFNTALALLYRPLRSGCRVHVSACVLYVFMCELVSAGCSQAGIAGPLSLGSPDIHTHTQKETQHT